MFDANDKSQAGRAGLFRSMVSDASRFLETCDGGDAGSPGARSIWLLGLEPGWSKKDDARNESEGELRARLDEYSIATQLQWPYNLNAFKLLTAIKGGQLAQYREFAEREQPFVRGSRGYLKANLFPAACHNTGEWGAEHEEETGFAEKSAYQQWMRANRFPVLRRWIETCRPMLIICCGTTHVRDFLAVTGAPSKARRLTVNAEGKRRSMYVSADGDAPVAVIPHLSNPYNPLSDREIAEIAAYIRQIIPRGG